MTALPPLLDLRRGRGLALVAALTLVQGVAAGVAAFATRALFEAMHAGAALPPGGLAALAGAGAVIAAARVAARVEGERIGQGYARQMRAALFDHAARMPARAVAARRAGAMSLRFVGDMAAFRNWLGLGLPRLIAAAVLIPALGTVLWLLHPLFAAVVLPVVLPCLLLIGFGGLRLVPLHRRLRLRRARIAAEMTERMPMAPQLDRLGRRGREVSSLDRRGDALTAAALRHRLSVETLTALPDLAAGVAAALVLLAGHRADLGPGSIAAALAVLGLLLAPLRDLAGVWNHRAAFRAAAAKAEVALSRGTRDLYRARLSLPKGRLEVTFEAVVLPSGRILSFRAEAGRTTSLPIGELDAAAVGDLLLGLDAPQAGRILLSGIDLQDLSRGSLRRGVGRVGTAPDILQGSLRRVLTLGCDPRPEDAVLLPLVQEAGLGPLLDRLGGLGGLVREGGRNLTTGERLGISLLRCRLHPPRLLLLGPEIDARQEAWIDARLGRKRLTVLWLRDRAQEDAATAA